MSNINEPASLRLTAFAGLPILWQPVFLGVLQGRQNFLWMGWASILGGVGRCLAVLVMVRLLGAHVSGAMTGLLAGSVVALGLCLWQTWPTLCGPADPFDWRGWLRRLVPLTLGLGASILMMGLDMIVVRRFFPASATGFYGAAGTLGRALVFFTVPMAAVMFPKVVQAAARGERSNVLAQALGVTALMGALAALGCTLFPALPLRLVWDESYLAVEPLVPWFAWCMLPLPLSNVLVNHLLAQQRYKAIPWLMLVIVCYGLTLVICCSKLAHTEPLGAFQTVVQILGGFGLLLLCVAAWFTWGVKHNSNSGTDSLGSRERKSHPDVVPG